MFWFWRDANSYGSKFMGFFMCFQYITAGVEDGVRCGGGDGGRFYLKDLWIVQAVFFVFSTASPSLKTAGPTLHWCNYKEGLWQINEIPFKWESPASILINSRSIPPFFPNLDQIKAGLLDGEHHSTVISTALSMAACICLLFFCLATVYCLHC